MVGARIQSVAISWEMYQRTGEALALGLVGLVQALPWILLAIPAGYLADIFNRRRLITLSLLGATLTSLGLAALSFSRGSVFLMYALLLLDATVTTLGRPARMALVPQIVPREVFPNAVTWNTGMMQLASVIGPAIGGFIVAINASAAYLISASSSVVFIFLLARLQIHEASRSSAPPSIQTLLAGTRFVWRNRLILTAISLDMFAVMLGGAVYLLPIFAKDILQIGPTGFGWLRAAPAIGAAFMALLMTYLPPMRRAGWSLLIAVAGFGVATIIFGLSRIFWLSMAMLFLTGAFDNISMVIRQTLVQLLTPDQMRGRVSAVTGIFVGASNELGGLESGLVAHWFGTIFSVVSGGIGTIIVVLITAALSPELRAFGALHEIKAAEEEEKEIQQLGAGSEKKI